MPRLRNLPGYIHCCVSERCRPLLLGRNSTLHKGQPLCCFHLQPSWCALRVFSAQQKGCGDSAASSLHQCVAALQCKCVCMPGAWLNIPARPGSCARREAVADAVADTVRALPLVAGVVGSQAACLHVLRVSHAQRRLLRCEMECTQTDGCAMAWCRVGYDVHGWETGVACIWGGIRLCRCGASHAPAAVLCLRLRQPPADCCMVLCGDYLGCISWCATPAWRCGAGNSTAVLGVHAVPGGT
ncbi:hypothetical protein COO60DRAFT_1150672 [Scenedesmus sp. NREL 46B-D3]|nr:hypothetical protein COO60DRAFT_1150672 [Scenedesmus sp. NREL 46B-D3]